MKEYEEFRFVVLDLKETYPNSWITIGELAEAEGQDPRTVRKRYGIPVGVNGIDRAVLARRKCKLAHD